MKKILFFILCLVSLGFSNFPYRFTYTFESSTVCNWNTYTEKYDKCRDTDYKKGNIKVIFTQDSMMYLTNSNYDKTYHIKINKIIEDYNDQNEKIMAFFGYANGENFTFVDGKSYFNFVKLGKWKINFQYNKIEKPKTLDSSFVYKTIHSTAICEYDNNKDNYEKNCHFKYKEDGDDLIVKVIYKNGTASRIFFTFKDEVDVYNVKRSKTVDNEGIIFYTEDLKNTPYNLFFSKTYIAIVNPNNFKVILDETDNAKTLDNTHTKIYSGSAVAINDSILLTNSHVISGAINAELYLNGEKINHDSMNIVDNLKDYFDLAIVKVNGVKLNACPLSKNEPNLGDNIFVYGYPNIEFQGTDLKMTQGIVSGKNGYKGDKNLFQFDAAIQHGNSGGPVVSNKKIIGLATSFLIDSQNVNFAIKSSKIYNFLEFNNIKTKANTTNFEKCTYMLLIEK